MTSSRQETFTSDTLSSITQYKCLSLLLSLSLCLSERGEKRSMKPVTVIMMEIIMTTVRIIVLTLFVFKTLFYFVCFTPCSSRPDSIVSLKMCLCLFYFWDKKKDKYIKISPHSEGFGVLALFHAVFSSSTSSSVHPKNIQLAENVNENTYFFYSCLSVSVVSSSLCLHPPFSLELACFFKRHVNLPSHLYRSFLCSCICLYAPPSRIPVP